jgi:hypothetical protein
VSVIELQASIDPSYQRLRHGLPMNSLAENL